MQDLSGTSDSISNIARPGNQGRSPRPFIAASIGALLSGGAVALFSGDWACSAIGAALLAACLCGLVAPLVGIIFRNRPRWAWIHVIAAAVIAATVQTAMIRQTLRDDAFYQAFGVDRPSAITDLRVERFYAGGPGDTVTLMRFRGDPSVIRQLVARLPATMADALASYRDKTLSWQQVWDSSFGMANGQSSDWWPDAPVMSRPQLYQGVPTLNHAAMGSSTILWDDDTGDVYVMISVG